MESNSHQWTNWQSQLIQPSLRLALVACAGVRVDGELELDGISGASDFGAFCL